MLTVPLVGFVPPSFLRGKPGGDLATGVFEQLIFPGFRLPQILDSGFLVDHNLRWSAHLRAQSK